MLWIYIWSSPEGFINTQRVHVVLWSAFLFFVLNHAFGAGKMIQWVEALAESMQGWEERPDAAELTSDPLSAHTQYNEQQ